MNTHFYHKFAICTFLYFDEIDKELKQTFCFSSFKYPVIWLVPQGICDNRKARRLSAF